MGKRKGLVIVIDRDIKLIENDRILYRGDSFVPVFEKLGIDIFEKMECEAEEVMKKVRRW